MFELPETVQKAADEYVRAKLNLDAKVAARTRAGTLILRISDLDEWEPFEKARDRWLEIAVLVGRP